MDYFSGLNVKVLRGRREEGQMRGLTAEARVSQRDVKMLRWL